MDFTFRDHIEKANQIAFCRLLEADPIWVDVNRAIDVIPGMEKNMILHAGPPIEWERMCPTLKNGMIGGALYEGWIKNPEQMEDLRDVYAALVTLSASTKPEEERSYLRSLETEYLTNKPGVWPSTEGLPPISPL